LPEGDQSEDFERDGIIGGIRELQIVAYDGQKGEHPPPDEKGGQK
jgi:hypothetical protein